VFLHNTNNPTSGILNLETSPVVAAKLYDLSGKLLYSFAANSTILDAYGYAGMFILEVETKEGIGRKRILIQ
jgi:hypothetical protein